MFLKRLDVSGFKSFAGKSVLDFEKGHQITAIVGPNGSGKSNIADSIRWVLGETSYKTVRAKKSEDVIFSGSNVKARASFARVAMVLDNSDGKASIDFSEVEIARSVYRDGSAEYLINGKKSRLLDVAELLAKSGFGQSTYSVIGQGMVDSMLFYGPAERKVLFDEAAGVRQYEIKREQTLRKLDDTHSNVIRAKDILSELTPRLSTLKRQSDRAKEKDVFVSELLEKQKIYFATIWDKLNHQEKEKRVELEKVSAEESKVSAEINLLNEAFAKIIGKEKVSTEETEKIQTKISELEKVKDALRQSIYTLRTKMELTLSAPTQKELENRISEERKKLSLLDCDEKNAQKSKLETDLERLSAMGFREKAVALDSERDALRTEIYRLKAQIELQTAENSLSKSDIESQESVIRAEIANLSIEKIEREISKNQQLKEKTQAELSKINEDIESKRAELSKLSDELSKFDFGVVGERIGKVLSLQNSFISSLAEAKNEKDIEGLRLVAEKITEKISELNIQVADVKEGRISGMTDVQMALEQLTKEKDGINTRLTEINSSLMSSDFEKKRASEERGRFERELERLSTLTPVDESERKAISVNIIELEKKSLSLTTEIENIRKEQEKESALRSQIIGFDFEIRREEEKRSEIESEITRLSAMKPADEGEKDGIQLQISEKEKQIAEIEKEITEQRAKINDRSAAFDEQGQKLSEIKDGLSAKQALLTEYGKELTALQVDLAKTETRKQDIKEEIVYELGSEAVLADAQVIPELNEAETRSAIEKLKNKLYAIGEIDPEVGTEFEEVSARVEFLSKQTEDLEKAKSDLEKLISELDIKIKKQFESSFSAISQKFTHFFTLLFDGGEAKLELVRQKGDEEDEEDRFGIEITAVPPGKKVKAISALSGGERTLTSLALLFAILSVNPAPFCVLDEVDAALDETNTKKFLKIVHELSRETQFIFISHNRETMKEASLIYGITMDESHASKILSVRLEEAIDVVEKK